MHTLLNTLAPKKVEPYGEYTVQMFQSWEKNQVQRMDLKVQVASVLEPDMKTRKDIGIQLRAMVNIGEDFTEVQRLANGLNYTKLNDRFCGRQLEKLKSDGVTDPGSFENLWAHIVEFKSNIGVMTQFQMAYDMLIEVCSKSDAITAILQGRSTCKWGEFAKALYDVIVKEGSALLLDNDRKQQVTGITAPTAVFGKCHDYVWKTHNGQW
jgi:hypothetical protein